MAQNPNYEQEIYNSSAAPAEGYSEPDYPDDDEYVADEEEKGGEALTGGFAPAIPNFFPADPCPYPLTSKLPEGTPTFKKNADEDVSPYISVIPNKNDHTKDIYYMKWADAWKWVKSTYPAACFEFVTSDNGRRKYTLDPELGYSVGVYLSLDGEKYFRPVELSVYDGNKMSRKQVPYNAVTTWGKTVTIAPPDDFDIKKMQMRCLCKAIAMVTGFGLRLWCSPNTPTYDNVMTVSEEMIADLRAKVTACGMKEAIIVKTINAQRFGSISSFDELTANTYAAAMGMIIKHGGANNAISTRPAAPQPEPAQAASPAPQAAPVQEAAPAPQEKPANEQPKQPRTRTAKPAQKPTAKPAPAEKPAPTAQPTQPAPAQPVETAATVEKPAPAPVQNAAPTPAPIQKPAAQAAPIQKPVAQAAPVEKPAPQAAPVQKPAPAQEAVPAQAENTDPFDNPFAGFDDFNPDEFGFDI